MVYAWRQLGNGYGSLGGNELTGLFFSKKKKVKAGKGIFLKIEEKKI